MNEVIALTDLDNFLHLGHDVRHVGWLVLVDQFFHDLGVILPGEQEVVEEVLRLDPARLGHGGAVASGWWGKVSCQLVFTLAGLWQSSHSTLRTHKG